MAPAPRASARSRWGAPRERAPTPPDALPRCPRRPPARPRRSSICASAERGCARFAMASWDSTCSCPSRKLWCAWPDGTRVAETVTSRLEPRRSGRSRARRPRERRCSCPRSRASPGSPAPANRGTEPRALRRGHRPTPRPRSAWSASRPCSTPIRDAGLVSAGMLETSRVAHAIATTRGCARSHDATRRELSRVGPRDARRGWRGRLRRATCTATSHALRIDEETERAVRVCRMSRRPASLDAGAYDVVMEPEAVTELLEWLAAIAFAAPEVEQGTSPMAGRLGQRITGESIDLVEDPLCEDPAARLRRPVRPRGYLATPRPSGRTRRRARRPLRPNLRRAHGAPFRPGAPSFPRSARAGGVGADVADASGRARPTSVDELVAGVERGLYVCRLHYVNGLARAAPRGDDRPHARRLLPRRERARSRAPSATCASPTACSRGSRAATG